MTNFSRSNLLQHSDLAVENALVSISSIYAEGWKWEVFYEEEPGLFRAFVKSPFCPEGEYGLVAAADLKDIPWISISTHVNVCKNLELMPKSLDLIRQIDSAMR